MWIFNKLKAPFGKTEVDDIPGRIRLNNIFSLPIAPDPEGLYNLIEANGEGEVGRFPDQQIAICTAINNFDEILDFLIELREFHEKITKNDEILSKINEILDKITIKEA